MLYFKNITNEELGAIVKASHEKHLERVALMTPQWVEEGTQFKNIRQQLHITQKQISEYVGVSDQVVAKFEKGKPIRSRNMFRHSYQNAITLIQAQRNNIALPKIL